MAGISGLNTALNTGPAMGSGSLSHAHYAPTAWLSPAPSPHGLSFLLFVAFVFRIHVPNFHRNSDLAKFLNIYFPELKIPLLVRCEPGEAVALVVRRDLSVGQLMRGLSLSVCLYLSLSLSVSGCFCKCVLVCADCSW